MKPEGQIIVVSGKIQADAAERWFPGLVTSWPITDLRPFSNRKVVIWPDNTAADRSRAAQTADFLIGSSTPSGPPREIKLIRYNGVDVDGWGPVAASDIMDRPALVAWMRDHVDVWEPEIPEPEAQVSAPEPQQPPEITPTPVYIDDSESEPPPADARDSSWERDDEPQPAVNGRHVAELLIGDIEPFKVLGHNHGQYYFQSKQTHQVSEFSAPELNESNLLTLAPLEYWEQAYPGGGKQAAFRLVHAKNAMIQTAHARGIFHRDRIRGRGAWIDRQRAIVHFGPYLMVDGDQVNPSEFKSNFVYEQEAPLDVTTAPPATNAEAHRLVELLRRITWQEKISADLLAGFCVSAPVCGALNWLSHGWVYGPSQSGKTAVKDICLRAIGKIAIEMAGGTSEPALRWELKFDARPTIFDEFEAEGRAQQETVKNILMLGRVASNKQTIAKVDIHKGGVIKFPVKTSLLAFAINPSISEYADQRRWTMFALQRNETDDRLQHYNDLIRDMNAWMGPDYAAKMFARTVKFLPILLANVKTFTDAAAVCLGDRGAADQLGMMLAGLYLCHSTNAITYDAAVEWIQKQDWNNHVASTSGRDERRLLMTITSTVRRISNGHGSKEISVGEMIERCAAPMAEEDMASERREMELDLGRIGIKVRGAEGVFVVANRSPPLVKILNGTPWAHGWNAQLKNLPGAKSHDKNVFFSAALGSPCRCVEIPLGLVVRGEGE